MWISKQTKTAERSATEARIGKVTAGGWESNVYLDGQRCGLPVMAPGGYRWRPKAGEQVLVLKTGAQGECACVLARQEESETELLPGEVELYAPGCALKLTKDGRVDVCGNVYVNGMALEKLIEKAVAAAQIRQEE